MISLLLKILAILPASLIYASLQAMFEFIEEKVYSLPNKIMGIIVYLGIILFLFGIYYIMVTY